MSKQLKKYMAVTTASFMVMQLAGCGSATEENVENIHTIPSNTENTGVEMTYVNEEVETEEVYEVPDHMTPEEYANDVVREQLEGVSESNMANACEEWQEDEDGSYECLDEDSPYYSQHFFNGIMFATAGAMIGSSLYKSHNLKNGTEKERIRSNAVVSPTNTRDKESRQNNATSGGGGSYSGGSKTNTNGTTTNGSTSSNSNGTTTNSSNTTSNGTNSNNSNSYSSGANSNSSNSYSNSSSSNSGKSGFGSGGGSRGGSSSS